MVDAWPAPQLDAGQPGARFRELLPLLTCRSLTLQTRDKIFTSCVQSVLTYASECWGLRKEERTELFRNDHAMVSWIRSVKTNDKVDTATLHNRLGIPDLESILHYNRLTWLAHVHHSQSWTKWCQIIEVEGRASRERPRKTWSDTIKEDMLACGLTMEMAGNRDV